MKIKSILATAGIAILAVIIFNKFVVGFLPDSVKKIIS
jgi:hypothetical protein